jgi:hypothetical protein
VDSDPTDVVEDSAEAVGELPTVEAVGDAKLETGDDGGSEFPVGVVVAGVVLLVIAGSASLVFVMRSRGLAFGASTSSRANQRSAAGGRAASLRAEKGPLAGRSFAVSRSPYTLGRGEECELTVPEAPVSRRHAQLVQQRGRWVLRDLGSSNGTFLNLQRLESPQPLHSGDLVFVGESAFHFSAPTGPSSQGRVLAKKRGSLVGVIVAAGIVLLLVGVAAVLLAGAKPEESEDGGLLPGLPSVEIPTVDLPPVDLPTVGLPTGMPTVGVPTGVPTMEIPTGLPVPTGGLPIPTGGLPIPTIALPSSNGNAPADKQVEASPDRQVKEP